MVWGLGGGVGVIGGGYLGQWIYNRAPPRMPLAAGAVTAASVLPMWCGDRDCDGECNLLHRSL